jgi:hypothetical protein
MAEGPAGGRRGSGKALIVASADAAAAGADALSGLDKARGRR